MTQLEWVISLPTSQAELALCVEQHPLHMSKALPLPPPPHPLGAEQHPLHVEQAIIPRLMYRTASPSAWTSTPLP